MCHALFDPLWQGEKNARQKRESAYRWLAEQMNIPFADCHFGHFDIHQLRQAYRILKDRVQMDV